MCFAIADESRKGHTKAIVVLLKGAKTQCVAFLTEDSSSISISLNTERTNPSMYTYLEIG